MTLILPSPPRRSATLQPKRLVARALAALLLALSPSSALASGAADEADLQFQIAAEHYQKGEYREALEHFLASNRLVPNKNVVFNIARTYEKLGRYADAHRYYTDALEEEKNPQTIQTIKASMQRIAPNVAVLRVETDPPGATIYIDRTDLGSRGKAPRALALPAGKYKIIVELEGYEPASTGPVEAKLGAETPVPLALRRITGKVEVGVEGAPDAIVHVDDEKAQGACTAPCSVELSPGRHLLYFSRDGFQAVPRQVNVVARETTRTTATLAPLTGTVVVSADEREAVVQIDGRPMGFTPAVIQNVPVGTRRVKVLLRGYAPVERVIEVKTGEQTDLSDLRLIPLRQVSAVSRYAESIDDAPSSLTILDSQELRAFGYPTIAEALRGVRGFSIANDGAYFSVGVRGLGQPGDYGNRVLVLSDGASLNDNLLSSSYIGSDGRDDLHDVSRIEVVRGPGSLLYGTGAFAGLVNLVPREKDEPSSVHGSIGTYYNNVVRGRVGFHYNFTPDIGLWASASGARSDGADVPVTLDSPLNNPKPNPLVQTAHNADYFRGWGTAGRFWARAFTLQWFFHTREQHLPEGQNAAVFNDLRQEYVDTRWFAEARYEPKIGDTIELMVRAHANRYTFHGEYPYDAPPDTPFVEDYAGTWYGGEARIAYTPMKAIRITAGGEAQDHRQADMVGTSGTAEGRAQYLSSHTPYAFGAGYLLAEASPVSWFRASAGVRVDGYPATFGAIPVPRAALIFKPWTGGVLKLMFGRAFRAPSVYQEFYNDGGQTQIPANAATSKLAPESVYSGEVELSHRFLEDWVALVAGHASYAQNLILLGTVQKPGAPLGMTVLQYVNSAFPALAIGGDAEIRREWRQGWMVSAYYSYEHAAYVNSNLANPQLVNAPQHLASLKGVVPVLPDLVSLAARVTLEAPRRIAAPSAVATPQAIVNTNATTPTSVVADLTVSGHLKKYHVGYVLGVYNVLDSRYAYPVTAKYLNTVLQQPGRTFLGDITVEYP
jgi:outer membrane receptor for ferrienterochelin and colicin